MKIHKQGLAVLAGVMLSGSVALAAPMAYVPNEKSGTVSVIDTATDTVVAEIKAGSKPRGLAVSADGKRLTMNGNTSAPSEKPTSRTRGLCQAER